MLRRAALAVAGGGGVAGAYGYKWANDNLGSDALDRIIQVCACLHATLLQIHDALHLRPITVRQGGIAGHHRLQGHRGAL